MVIYSADNTKSYQKNSTKLKIVAVFFEIDNNTNYQ